jgi:hypothetical protein
MAERRRHLPIRRTRTAIAPRITATRDQDEEVPMEKLKLPVDSLEVETFDAGDGGKAGGTVHAHMTPAGGACCTRDGTGCHTVVLTTPCNNC